MFLLYNLPYSFDLVLISNSNFLLWLHKKNFLHDFWDSVVCQEALLHTNTTTNNSGLVTLSYTIADKAGLVTLCDRRVWRFPGGAWRGSYFSRGQWRGRNLASTSRTKSLQKTQHRYSWLSLLTYTTSDHFHKKQIYSIMKMFCLDILPTGHKNLMFLRHCMLTLNAAVLINSIKHWNHSIFTLEVK